MSDPADSKIFRIRNGYTFWQRVYYVLRRYCVFAVILVPCYLYLTRANQEDNALLSLMVTRITRSTVGVLLGLIFMKFAFPKIALQTELIEDQNIAIALLFAAIIIGVNL